MDKEFKNKLILTVIDKLVFGLAVGIIILIGQFYVTSNIEKRKSILSYQTAIAQIHAENIQQLWHAIYNWGGAIRWYIESLEGDVTEEGMGDKLIKASEDFQSMLNKSGAYLGRDKVVSIEKRIGSGFLAYLQEFKNTNDREWFSKKLIVFQDDYVSILKDLEQELRRGPTSKLLPNNANSADAKSRTAD